MPALFKSNLFQRIIGALLLLPPVLFSLVQGGLYFMALLLVAAAVMAYEWNSITKQKMRSLLTFIATVLAAITVTLGIVLGKLDQVDSALAIVGLVGALILAFVISVFEAPTSGVDTENRSEGEQIRDVTSAPPLREELHKQGRPNSFRWAMAGFPYLMMVLLSLSWLRTLDQYGLVVLWLFLAVWAADVGGYFAGKGIGGPKLMPRISPKKTWSGFVGGTALSAFVSAVTGWLIGWHSIDLLALAGVGVALVAQAGDLFESYVKRRFGTKDSGSFIPGHGGLLDRVDGLIVASPVTALVAAVWITVKGPIA